MNYIKYQLYLLQIENYEIDRYFRLLFKKGYFKPSSPLRKSLVWTKKIILLLIIALLLIILSTYSAFNFGVWFAILWLLISIIIMPIYYAIALYLTLPFDLLAKRRILAKAKALVNSRKQLKIIGIAGSYGKTTMKYVIYNVLSQKYNVAMPSGNTNTALGLSNWILRNKLDDAEILLIEFGEEYPGDNKRIAEIFPQDFVIITGINEAHFERMRSIEKSAETIFESLHHVKKEAVVYLNLEDANIEKYGGTYLENVETKGFGKDGTGDYQITGKSFDQNSLTRDADISGIGRINISFLSEYIYSDVAAAVDLAGELNVDKQDILNGLGKIAPVEHRLQPIVNEASGVLVIDDSYNGNPAGVEEAIKTLQLFKDRRKIYLTPGLVEAGSRNKEVHEKIGELLSDVADKVILIKNSATPHIYEALKMAGFSQDNIIWFDSAQEAHNSLGNILKPNDVILFQNDWGDQYL